MASIAKNALYISILYIVYVYDLTLKLTLTHIHCVLVECIVYIPQYGRVVGNTVA